MNYSTKIRKIGKSATFSLKIKTGAEAIIAYSLNIIQFFCCIFAAIFNCITMDKTIITVVGKDTVGIIAKVCTYLAENKVNILDISQTIVQGYFNMMMIVDMQKSEKVHDEISTDLNKIGEELGVIIKCQREEIFNKMHRI